MKIAIFGTSGFANEVADICYTLGFTSVKFLSEVEPGFGVVLEDNPENISDLKAQGFQFAIGIGKPKLREKISLKYEGLEFPNLVHPSATFGIGQKEGLECSRGNIVTAGARLTNNIRVGNFCIMNLNVTVGHDSILEDFTSLMPGVNISGNVHLAPRSYVGTGASIINGGNNQKLTVGKDAVIGAGAVVTKNIPESVTAVGVPARILQR